MNKLLNAVRSSINNGRKGPSNPGNWGPSATHAIEYRLVGQLPLVFSPDLSYVYFDSEAAMETWIDVVSVWTAKYGYGVGLSCSVYYWDLGPQFLKHLTIE